MKKIFLTTSAFILLISVFIIFKPFEPKEKIIYIAPQPTPSINTSLPSGSEKVEVFVFHTTQRCISCINIGKYTKSVIEEKLFELNKEANEFIFDSKESAPQFEPQCHSN
jgi:threonine dehydratase